MESKGFIERMLSEAAAWSVSRKIAKKRKKFRIVQIQLVRDEFVPFDAKVAAYGLGNDGEVYYRSRGKREWLPW